MAFDFDGARKAGYSDTEIADHVKTLPDVGFDIDGARKAGYADTEIIEHIKGLPAPAKAAKPTQSGPVVVQTGLPVPEETAPPATSVAVPASTISERVKSAFNVPQAERDATVVETGLPQIEDAAPEPARIKMPGSVLNGIEVAKLPQVPAPVSPVAPLRAEAYDALQQRADAMPAPQRAMVEKAPGVVGSAFRQATATRPERVARQEAIAAGSPEVIKTPDEVIAGIKGPGPSITDADAGLSDAGKTVKRGAEWVGQNSNSVVRGFAKGAAGLGQSYAGLREAFADLIGSDAGAADAREAQTMWKGMQNSIEAPGQFRQGADITQAKDSMGRWIDQGIENATASITRQLPGFLTGRSGLALTQMFMDSFGESYGEAKAYGKDANESLARASLFATFEVAGEKLGLDYMLPRMKQMAKGVSTEQLPEFFAGLLKRELPGELFTHAGQSITDASAIGIRPGMTLEQYFSEVPTVIRDTILQTGMMAGSGRVMNKAAQSINDARMAAMTPENQAASELDQLVQGSYFTQQGMDAQVRAAMDPAAAQMQRVGPNAPAPQVPVALPGSKQDLENLLADDRSIDQIRQEQAAQVAQAEQAMQQQAADTKAAVAAAAQTTAQVFSDTQAAKHGVPAVGTEVVVPYADGPVTGQVVSIGTSESGGWEVSIRENKTGQIYSVFQEDGLPLQGAQDVSNLDTGTDASLPAGGAQAGGDVAQRSNPMERAGDAIQPSAGVQVADATQPSGGEYVPVANAEGGAETIAEAAHQAATSPLNDTPQPTQAQIDAGNYKKGHIAINGLDISIENPAGSPRRGTDPSGQPWEVQMQDHYGYIRGTVGKDKDHIDVFLVGDNPQNSRVVYVVDQVDPNTSKFDEHKVLMGIAPGSVEEAKAAYLRNYNDADPRRIGAITQVSLDDFKKWAFDGKKNKPYAYNEGAKVVKDLAMQAQKEAGWNSEWPFIPADLMNADFRKLIENDPALSRQEKDAIFEAGRKLGVVPKAVATAPEHKGNEGKPLDESTVYEPTADPAKTTDTAPIDEGIVPLTMSQDDFKEITDEWAALFAAPAGGRVVTENRPEANPHISLEQAQERIEEWKAHVKAQFADDKTRQENSTKTVLSLFDLSGQWSQPWRDAGYNVITIDIQSGHDVNDFSVEYFTENWDIENVYAILAATPCTDFASSGARHFATKDADGRTEASKELVFQTLRTIEYFRPSIWALENPVGRIERLTGLPPARMTFDPNHFGDTYTKKTMLWGKFEAEMPLAPVDPIEGSKMHAKYGGKSQATKNARSVTPEGFAYAFFMANNYADMPAEVRLENDFPEASGAVKAALKAGVTEERIRELMEDTYGNYEYDEARNALLAEVAAIEKKAKKPTKPAANLPGKTITFGEWRDIGKGYQAQQEIGGSRQNIKTPEGNIITRGLDTKGEEYWEFEMGHSPFSKGGMSWVDKAQADLKTLNLAPQPAAAALPAPNQNPPSTGESPVAQSGGTDKTEIDGYRPLVEALIRRKGHTSDRRSVDEVVIRATALMKGNTESIGADIRYFRKKSRDLAKADPESAKLIGQLGELAASKAKAAKNDPLAEIRKFYTPGNIIHVDYWNQYDKVLDFTEKDGDWSVTVQQVKKEGDQWVVAGEKRMHRTTPGKDKIVDFVQPPQESSNGTTPAKAEQEQAEQPQAAAAAAVEKPKPKHENGHVAAGFAAFKEGKPRELPSYFLNSKGKNPRDWLRGWDAAKAASTTVITDSTEDAAAPKADPDPIDALKSRITTIYQSKAGNNFSDGMRKTADKMYHAIVGRNAVALADILNMGNKVSRQVFEDIIKAKLPNTVKGTQEAIMAFLGKIDTALVASATAPATTATAGDITEPSITRRANPGNMGDQSFVARAFLKKGDVPIRGEGATEADALLNMMRDADRVIEASKPVEKEPPSTEIVYQGAGGAVFDQEAIFRKNRNGVNLNPDTAGALGENANIFAQSLQREAQAAFDANGNFIAEKYRFVPKGKSGSGIRLFNDLTEAKQFADAYGQKKDQTPAEPRKRIGKGDRGQTIFENEQGVRSYTESGFKYVEESGKPRGATFKTVEELSAEKKPATVIPDSTTVTPNTVFTEDAAAAARAILKKKLGQLNSGIDPELMQAGITLAGYHIEKGARTFAAYAKAMIEDLGGAVKPYLKSWYMGVKYDPRASGFDGMSSAGEVEGADVDALTTENAVVDAPPSVREGAKLAGAKVAADLFQWDKKASTTAKVKIAVMDYLYENLPEAEAKKDLTALSDEIVDEIARNTASPILGEKENGNESATAGTTGDRPLPGASSGSLFADEGSGDAGGVRPRSGRGGNAANGNSPVAGTRSRNGKRNGNGGSVSPRGTPEQTPGATGDLPLGERADPAPRLTDYTITEDTRLGEGGAKTKFKQNIAAIRLIADLEESSRQATQEEQHVLARYVGWGGLSQAFDPTNQDWAKEYAELKSVLNQQEWDAAYESTQYAHYTSAPIITNGIYGALTQFGFSGGRTLEPGSGVGNMVGLMPVNFRTSGMRVTAVEREWISAKIGKHLYPNHNMLHADFTEFKADDNYFDAVIGNPPFSRTPLTDVSGRKHLSGLSIHNYFFAKSVDMLRPGGVFAMVVSNSFLDATKDNARRYIGERTRFLGAIRLPNNAFKKNAGTEVTTDIVFLQKLPEEDWGSKAAKDAAKAWMDTQEVADPLGGEAIPLNAYFVAHPEMMLGRMERSGSMYGANQAALVAEEGANIEEQLKEAILRLPANVYVPPVRQNNKKATESLIVALEDSTVQEGGHYTKDGKLYVRLRDEAGEQLAQELTPTTQWTEKKLLGEEQHSRLIALADLRRTVRQLLAAEIADDTDGMDRLRKQLNDQYDHIVKKWDFLSATGTQRLFGDDPDYPLLAALEQNYNKGIDAKTAKEHGVAVVKPKADKMPIFRQRVVPKHVEITKADTPADALMISIFERGRIDEQYISDLLGGRDAKEIITELADQGHLFMDPDLNHYVLKDEYLSGNVRRKLKIAKATGLVQNATALEAVIPEDIPSHNIIGKMGANWIPDSTYKEFAVEILGEGTEARIKYQPTAGSFIANLTAGSEIANTNTFGINRDGGRATDLIEKILNKKAIKIGHYDKDGKFHLDKEATDEANDKANEIKTRFGDWLFSDAERSELLTRAYNDTVNNYVVRKFDGSLLSFPGKVPDQIIKFRRHQRNAIARILQTGQALLDHVVGAGKTFTVVAAAMEMRRTGMAQKPMVVVPNHLVKQWASDFYRLYPGAKILAATKKDFQRENRRAFLAKVATGDWDAVVIAHSSFGFIRPEKEFEIEFTGREIQEITDAINELGGDVSARDKSDGRDKATKRTVKQLAARREKLKERIKSLRDKPMDNLLDLAELGVDALFVDEAHAFKNLMFTTKMQGVRVGGDPSGSQRAYDMYIKVHQVMKKNSGRGIVFATGTPISNSMGEMYHVLRYLAPQTLEDMSLKTFDAWADSFASVEQVWMQAMTGDGYKSSMRLTKFINVPSLLKIYDQVADTVTIEDIKDAYREENGGKEFPIPAVKGGTRTPVSIPRSETQTAYMEDIAKRAKDLEKRKGPPKKGEDNMLSIMGDARKAAMDMRLVDHTIIERDPNSRIAIAAKNIWDRYQKYDGVKGTQLVFSDMGTPKKTVRKELKEYQGLKALADRALEQEIQDRATLGDEDALAIIEEAEEAQAEIDAKGKDWLDAIEAAMRGFSIYDDMKQALIEHGIPEHEIAFIHDYNTDDQKAALFKAVNAGKIRVLLGSTPKMGAGTNVQERLVALHHLDIPWRPSDVEQREGRIVRQGNALLDEIDGFEVEILAYATQDTLDLYMWQTQENKLKMIGQLRSGNVDIEMDNAFEQMELSAGEMQAAATSNPYLLDEIRLRDKIKKLERQKRSHEGQINDLVNRVASAKRGVQSLPKEIERARAIEAGNQDYEKLVAEVDAAMTTTIQGKTVKGRSDIIKAVSDAVAGLRGSVTVTIAGTKVKFKSANDFLDMVGEIQNKYGTEIKEVDLDGETVAMGPYGRSAAEKVENAIEKTAHDAIKEKGIEFGGKTLKSYSALAEAVRNLTGDRDRIIFNVGGEDYTQRSKIEKAIEPIIAKAVDEQSREFVGQFGGVNVYVEAFAGKDAEHVVLNVQVEYKDGKADADVTRPGGWDTEVEPEQARAMGMAAITRAIRLMDSAKYSANDMEQRLEKAKRTISDGEGKVGEAQKWDGEQELTEARNKYAEILKKLSGKSGDESLPVVDGDALVLSADEFQSRFGMRPNFADGFVVATLGGGAYRNNPEEPFKTREDARAWIDSQIASNPGESASFLFGRRDTSGLPPISERAVRDTLNRLVVVGESASKAYVIPLANEQELPQEIKEEARKAGINLSDIHGVLSKGYAYIIRKNIKTQKDLEEVIFHEVLGHGGARALLGKARYPFLLEQFYRAGGVGGLRTIARAYGALDQFNIYVPADFRTLGDDKKVELVDELLAQAAGKASGKWQKVIYEWMGSLKRAIIEWLEKAGLKNVAAKLDTFGIGETALLLRDMRQAIVDGAAMDGRDVAFMARPGRSDSDARVQEAADLLDEAPGEGDAADNVFGLDRPLASDIWMPTRLAVHPRTIAAFNKQFTPVFQAASDMFELRDKIAAEIQERSQPYFDLTTEEKHNVNAVLELGRLNRTVYGRGQNDVVAANESWSEAELSRPGDTITLTGREKAGYWAIRQSMDLALNIFKAQFIHELGLDPRQFKTAEDILNAIDLTMDDKTKERYEHAAKVVREIEQARRTGYIPFQRWGNIGLIVEQEVEEQDEITGEWVSHKDIVRFEKIEQNTIDKIKRFAHLSGRELGEMPEVKERLDALRGKYRLEDSYSIRVVNLSNPKEAATVDMAALDGLASLAGLDESAWEGVKEQLEIAQKKKSFRAHFFGARNTPGYSPDFERAIADYIVGISGYLARRQYVKKFDRSIEKIPGTMPKLADYARKYRDYVNKPVEEFAAARQATFFYYLSGVPATAMVNLTQVPLITMPYLTQFVGMAQANRALAVAYKDAMGMLTRKKGMDFFDPAKAPADVRAALHRAWNEGFFVPLQTYEMMGLAQNRSKALRKLSKGARAVVDTASFMFSAAERMNRIVTFIAAHRIASNPETIRKIRATLKGNALARSDLRVLTPETFAEWVVDETHYRMGKVNRPTMMRGVGTWLTQFKSFTWQTIELFTRMGMLHGKEGRAALGAVLLLYVLSSGVWGFPFADDLREIYEFLYKKFKGQDIDTKTDLRLFIHEITSSAKFAEVVGYGLPRLIDGGPDISRRIGMGNILPSPNEEVLGVPMDLIFKRLSRAIDFEQLDLHTLAAAEMMPNFLKNPIHAAAWATQGVRSQKGRVVIPPEHVTMADIIQKAIGFTPSDVSEYREMKSAEKRTEARIKDVKSDYYAKIARVSADMLRAEERHDDAGAKSAEKELAEIYAEIGDHNAKAKHEDIIKIDRNTLRKKISEEMLGAEARKKGMAKQARGKNEAIERAFGY
jgi:N12 class adenine-specific DNA methylase